LFIGCLSGTASAQEADIYLLMGQSNMSGRGDLAAMPAVRPDDVWMYTNSGQWTHAVEPVDDATGQVDAVSADPQAGYSPSLAFGLSLQRRTGRSIGLVPCARGGSAMEAWQPATSRDTLYGSCLARAREARRYGVIRGVVWLQGESDAMTSGLADLWPTRFATLVAALRRDLGDAALPMVFGQLGADPHDVRFPFWEAVKEKQAAVALAHTAMVKTDDLPMRVPHYTAAGCARLGDRLAAAMAALIDGRRP
jgi:hypothetical protein